MNASASEGLCSARGERALRARTVNWSMTVPVVESDADDQDLLGYIRTVATPQLVATLTEKHGNELRLQSPLQAHP